MVHFHDVKHCRRSHGLGGKSELTPKWADCAPIRVNVEWERGGKSTVEHMCAHAHAARAVTEQLCWFLSSHGLTPHCRGDTEQLPLAHTQREKVDEAK